MKFPKTIYVTIEKDHDGDYLCAFPELETCGDGAKVGVYSLLEKGTLQIDRKCTIVPNNPKKDK